MLKPRDLVVCLHLATSTQRNYSQIAEALHMSLSMAHRAVQRAGAAKLIENGEVIRPNLLELLEHGVRHVYYPELGGPSRGVPTGAAAPGLRDRLTVNAENSPVWPHPKGRARGPGIVPLDPSVAEIARENPTLHTALAAVDLIRIGTARERAVAGAVLRELLS